jgi:hypothetical protein
MPTPDLKAGLLLEKARRATPPQAIGDILAALSLTPPPAGAALFSLHAACRELRTSHQDLFDRLWEERLKTGHPPWLLLDDLTLTTTAEWLDTPTHAQARDYHRGHAGILGRPGARTALDELALAGIDPDLIGQYRQLLATAAERGIQQAYRPLVVEESLSAWLDADVPEQQQFLREDRETLLSSEVAELLSQWSAEDPDDTMPKFGAALLSLAQDGLESEVFAALDDPRQLNLLLSDLLAAGKPQQLRGGRRTCAVPGPGRSGPGTCAASPGDRARHDPACRRCPRTRPRRRAPGPRQHQPLGRHPRQLVPAHPELAALIQALVTTPPDEPNGMSRRDHQADP